MPKIDLKTCMPGLEWAGQVAEGQKCPSHQFSLSLSISSPTEEPAGEIVVSDISFPL